MNLGLEEARLSAAPRMPHYEMLVGEDRENERLEPTEPSQRRAQDLEVLGSNGTEQGSCREIDAREDDHLENQNDEVVELRQLERENAKERQNRGNENGEG